MSEEDDSLRVINGEGMDIELPVIDSYLKGRIIARIIECDLKGPESATVLLADIAFVIAALHTTPEEMIRPWDVLDSVSEATKEASKIQRELLNTGNSEEQDWRDVCAEVVRVADQGRAAMIERLGQEIESEGRRRWIKRQTP